MRHLLKGLISFLGLIAILLFTSLTVSAHPEDDFVQASYLTLTGEELLLDLDFRIGVEITSQVIATIDTDGDGIISELEASTYADQVTAALRLEINGQAIELTRLGMEFPSVAMLEDDLGIIQFHFSAPLPNTYPGKYEIIYENAFAPEGLTNHYLVNGFVQRTAQNDIDITAQERDWEQQSITLTYTFLTTPILMSTQA